jgi:hypothetical protein
MPRHDSTHADKPQADRPQADKSQTDKDLALRRAMRIETGRVTREPAINRIDNTKVRAPRKPSMPKMPWDEAPQCETQKLR